MAHKKLRPKHKHLSKEEKIKRFIEYVSRTSHGRYHRLYSKGHEATNIVYRNATHRKTFEPGG